MSGEACGDTPAVDKRRQSSTNVSLPTQSNSYAPESPPLLDPTTFRYPRLTPNLRDMIQGFGQGVADPNVSMNELLQSPDPTAMYNSLQIGSPIIGDIYPSQNPMTHCGTSYEASDPAAERTERMAGACAEMNALFSCYPTTTTESGYRFDEDQSGGVMSMMSSPEIEKSSVKMSASGLSSSTSNINSQGSPDNNFAERGSESSSQTPPPADVSNSSPSVSPDVQEGRPLPRVERSRSEKPWEQSAVESENHKQQVSKIWGGSAAAVSLQPKPAEGIAKAVSAEIAKSEPVVQKPRSAPNNSAPMATAASIAAANSVGMNPAVANLMPFACAMPAGMNLTMLPPGTVHYQGRPMAFVAGAHGTELIPVDILAQATALQYGAAAHAAATQMMQSMGRAAGMPRTFAPPFEPLGVSRKKRRRQLLERSGCSEEQARQNRAHALKRLRQKKTMRNQQSTVRYACRKRIAMVRPRVNGRFATKEEVEECQRTQD